MIKMHPAIYAEITLGLSRLPIGHVVDVDADAVTDSDFLAAVVMLDDDLVGQAYDAFGPAVTQCFVFLGDLRVGRLLSFTRHGLIGEHRYEVEIDWNQEAMSQALASYKPVVEHHDLQEIFDDLATEARNAPKAPPFRFPDMSQESPQENPRCFDPPASEKPPAACHAPSPPPGILVAGSVRRIRGAWHATTTAGELYRFSRGRARWERLEQIEKEDPMKEEDQVKDKEIAYCGEDNECTEKDGTPATTEPTTAIARGPLEINLEPGAPQGISYVSDARMLHVPLDSDTVKVVSVTVAIALALVVVAVTIGAFVTFWPQT